MARRPSIYCLVDDDFKTAFDVALAQRRTSMQTIVQGLVAEWIREDVAAVLAAAREAREAVAQREKRQIGAEAAIRHLLDQYLGKNVGVKKENIGDQSTLGEENRGIPDHLKGWVEIASLAAQVEDPFWRQMLTSVRGQLELISERARAELDAKQGLRHAPYSPARGAEERDDDATAVG